MKKSPKPQTPPPITRPQAPDLGNMEAEEFASLKSEYAERKAKAQARYYRLKNDIKCGHLLHHNLLSRLNGKINGVFQSQFLVLSETLPSSYGQSLAKAAAAAGKKKDREGNPYTQASAVIKIAEIVNDAGYATMGKIKDDMGTWIETLTDADIE